MTASTIDISVKGKWVTVPCAVVHDDVIISSGKWIKIAEVHDEEWCDHEVRDPALCIQTLKSRQPGLPRADLFTFSQKPNSPEPRFDYRHELESVATIHLTTYQQWWEDLPQGTRKNVRRAQRRGVEVMVEPFGEPLLRGIMDVNNDSPMRQGRPYLHYGKTLEQTQKDHSAFLDRSEFLCAYLEGKMIGFIKLVFRGDVASILQIVSKPSANDVRPTNALIDKAVERCEANGATCLTYGLFRYGNKSDDSLQEFKIRNGFVETLVPRYYVPLNLWGWFCSRTRLYRGLLGLLPSSVILRLVNLRAKLYHLRNRKSRCSSTQEQPQGLRQTECSTPPTGSSS